MISRTNLIRVQLYTTITFITNNSWFNRYKLEKCLRQFSCLCFWGKLLPLFWPLTPNLSPQHPNSTVNSNYTPRGWLKRLMICKNKQKQRAKPRGKLSGGSKRVVLPVSGRSSAVLAPRASRPAARRTSAPPPGPRGRVSRRQRNVKIQPSRRVRAHARARTGKGVNSFFFSSFFFSHTRCSVKSACEVAFSGRSAPPGGRARALATPQHRGHVIHAFMSIPEMWIMEIFIISQFYFYFF